MSLETLLYVLLAALIALAAYLLGRRAGGPAPLAPLQFQLETLAKNQERLESAFREALSQQRQETGASLFGMSRQISERIDAMRSTVDGKLEEIRLTVDQKLQETLEKRLGESFQLVSERLEQVHKGLGEMQSLASSVGDLKAVLSNVKSRGTWGEVQLGALLEQVLTPEQYGTNVAVTGTNERVEFAIRLPGAAGDRPVWLPIDAKFPLEQHQRLEDARERVDLDGIRDAEKELVNAIRLNARTIRDKYVAPPATTDFGILFLPTESLYAEVLRRPGLTDSLQREFRVTVAGPSTLSALLNSLQMGFRTLAIQQRSSEVWKVLTEAKTEFGKYGAVLDEVQKHLAKASKTVEEAGARTRAIERKLRDVQELPAAEAASG